MRQAATTCCVVIALLSIAACRQSKSLDDDNVTAPVARGGVRGHVRVTGPVPENDALRMASDPMCRNATQGRRVVDEAVIVAADGAVKNVFVQLVGDFPETPVPADTVAVDQRGCIYEPRVVGLRVGQTLQVRNSDAGLHNVHGSSSERDSFNVSQPMSGMTNTFRPRDPGMLHLKCDVHTWMAAFVGVVNHPYFSVTGADGAFVLRDVPAGTYTLRAWHERFGAATSQVRVDAGGETALDISYAAAAAPAQ